jgi:ferredoxin|tara:strand:- start:159 stop:365 length:207 start_codon:yes stop_codon:yes gene_type:complete
MCDPECPNEAIYMGAKIYQIDSERCTECIGHYEKPTCISVCPIDCIKPDPNCRETLDELADKYIRING